MINDNELNFVKKNGMMNCPLCNGPCSVKTVGFYKCYFNILNLMKKKMRLKNSELK